MSRTTSSDVAQRRAAGARRSQRGFTLAAMIVLLTLISITIAYTVPPQWSKIMQRDRDRQTIFAMKQFARAVYEFRRKNNVYPTSVSQLEEARQPHFFRGGGMPVDPVTGEADWLIIPATAQNAGGVTLTGVGGNVQNDAAPGGPARPPGQTTDTTGTAAVPPGVPAKEFSGPMGGIRPNRTGKSFLALNGRENYEEWTYTVMDLEQELMLRQAGLAFK